MRFSSTLICLLAAFFTNALSDQSCEELKSDIKMKIVRDALKQAKIFFPTCRDADEDSAKCGKSSNALAHINLAINTLEGMTLVRNKDCPICPEPIVKVAGPIDCEGILKMGHKESGVYTIYPKDSPTKGIQVYCDMETDGGGWTVIQRRGHIMTPDDFFNQDWETYKNGFGDLTKEFWLGNEYIHAITTQGQYSARFDLRNHNGEEKYAIYNSFAIEDERNNYKLTIGDYSGTAGDSISNHNHRAFYTKDRPNPPEKVPNYRQVPNSGWWFNIFPSSNLNGLKKTSGKDGIVWYYFNGYSPPLVFTEIKLRARRT